MSPVWDTLPITDSPHLWESLHSQNAPEMNWRHPGRRALILPRSQEFTMLVWRVGFQWVFAVQFMWLSQADMNLLHKYLLNISYLEGTTGVSSLFSPHHTWKRCDTVQCSGGEPKPFHKQPLDDVLWPLPHSEPVTHTNAFRGQRGPFLPERLRLARCEQSLWGKS